MLKNVVPLYGYMGQADIPKEITRLEFFKGCLPQISLGLFFEYHDLYLKSSKSYLLVKEKYLENAVEPFRESEVKVTKERKRHLGAVIGNEAYKKSYPRLLVDEWVQLLELFSKIAKSGPQSAYSASVRRFMGKLIFFVRTIPNLWRSDTIAMRNILRTFS